MFNSVLIVGGCFLDTIIKPPTIKKKLLGGGGANAATAASLFAPTALAANVGKDFPDKYYKFMIERQIDTSGIRTKREKTIQWEGRIGQEGEVTKARMDFQLLSVPQIPNNLLTKEYILISAYPPTMQHAIFAQIKSYKHKMLMLDTHLGYVKNHKDILSSIVKKVDLFILNQKEAQLFSQKENISDAARKISALGPENIVIKMGSKGAFLKTGQLETTCSACKPKQVIDTVGAGDTFAGAMLGYLAQVDDISPSTLIQGMHWGIVMASFNLEGTGMERFKSLTYKEAETRFKSFQAEMLNLG